MDADLHDLTAAYALDALDADEADAYEAHLAQCDLCRGELATLTKTATALAWAIEAPAPPERLRSRILEAAGAERTNVVPLPSVRCTTLMSLAGSWTPSFVAAMAGSFHFLILPRKMAAMASGESFKSPVPVGRL